MKRLHTIIRVIAAVLVASMCLQDVVWAHPDALQIPSFFLARNDESKLLSELKCLVEATPDIRSLNLHLMPVVDGVTVEMDFRPPVTKDPKRRYKYEEDGKLYIPCSISSLRSCRLYDGVVDLTDKSVSLRHVSGEPPSKPESEKVKSVPKPKPDLSPEPPLDQISGRRPEPSAIREAEILGTPQTSALEQPTKAVNTVKPSNELQAQSGGAAPDEADIFEWNTLEEIDGIAEKTESAAAKRWLNLRRSDSKFSKSKDLALAWKKMTFAQKPFVQKTFYVAGGIAATVFAMLISCIMYFGQTGQIYVIEALMPPSVVMISMAALSVIVLVGILIFSARDGENSAFTSLFWPKDFRRMLDDSAYAKEIAGKLQGLGINDNWDNPDYRMSYVSNGQEIAEAKSSRAYILAAQQALKRFIGQMENSRVKNAGDMFKALNKPRSKRASEFHEKYKEVIESLYRGDIERERLIYLFENLRDNFVKEGSKGEAYIDEILASIPEGAPVHGSIDVRIWQRDPWHDLSDEETLNECIWLGGCHEEAALEYIRNKSVTMLDFYSGAEHLVRVTLEAVTYTAGGKEEPILIVECMGGSDKLNKDIIKRAIEDYTKACNFPYVLYNNRANNNMPGKFIKYLKLQKLKPMIVPISFVDISRKVYLELFSVGMIARRLACGWAVPRGIVEGYCVNVLPAAADPANADFSQERQRQSRRRFLKGAVAAAGVLGTAAISRYFMNFFDAEFYRKHLKKGTDPDIQNGAVKELLERKDKEACSLLVEMYKDIDPMYRDRIVNAVLDYSRDNQDMSFADFLFDAAQNDKDNGPLVVKAICGYDGVPLWRTEAEYISKRLIAIYEKNEDRDLIRLIDNMLDNNDNKFSSPLLLEICTIKKSRESELWYIRETAKKRLQMTDRSPEDVGRLIGKYKKFREEKDEHGISRIKDLMLGWNGEPLPLDPMLEVLDDECKDDRQPYRGPFFENVFIRDLTKNDSALLKERSGLELERMIDKLLELMPRIVSEYDWDTKTRRFSLSRAVAAIIKNKGDMLSDALLQVLGKHEDLLIENAVKEELDKRSARLRVPAELAGAAAAGINSESENGLENIGSRAAERSPQYINAINRAIGEMIIFCFRDLALRVETEHKPDSLADLAIELKSLGLAQEAQYALKEAFDKVKQMPLYNSRASALTRLALAGLESGDNEESCLGILKEARALVDKVPYDNWKNLPMLDIASAYVALGHREEAKEALLVLAKLAEGFDKPEEKRQISEKDQALQDVAKGLARAGFFADAEKVLPRIKDPIVKYIALEDLLPMMVEAGRSDDAMSKIRDYPFPSFHCKAEAAAKIAQSLAQHGEIDRIFESGDESLMNIVKKRDGQSENKSHYYEESVNLAIAKKLAETGETEKAKEYTGKLYETGHKIEIWSLIAQRLAETGKREEALFAFNEAEAIFKVGSDKYNMSDRIRSLLHFANIQRVLGNPGEEKSLLWQARRKLENIFAENKGQHYLQDELTETVTGLIRLGGITSQYDASGNMTYLMLARGNMRKILSAFIRQLAPAEIRVDTIRDAVAYVKSGLPYHESIMEEYFSAADKPAYIRGLREKTELLIDEGFDPKDEKERFLAFLGVTSRGIDVTESDYNRMLKGLMSFASGLRKKYFTGLFDQRGYPVFRISEKEGIMEDSSGVDAGKVQKHAEKLLTIYADTLNLAGLDESLKGKVYAYCKLKTELDLNPELRKKMGSIAASNLGNYLRRHHAELSPENVSAYLAELSDKNLLTEAIFFVAFHQFIGTRSDKFLDLMLKSIIADAFVETTLRTAAENKDDVVAQLKAIMQIYTDRKFHMPERLKLPLHKGLIARIEALAGEVEEEMKKISLKRASYSEPKRYTFIPSRFLGVFRGFVGLDCTAKEDDGKPYTRAMHEDTMYYIVYEDGKAIGYIGLMEAVSGVGKVLTIDTMQPVPPQIVPQILKKLSAIAQEKGFIGIALPSSKVKATKERTSLEASFNYPEVRDAVLNLPGYKNGKRITAKPVHQKSWERFNKFFGVHVYDSIVTGKFILYDPSSGLKLPPSPPLAISGNIGTAPVELRPPSDITLMGGLGFEAYINIIKRLAQSPFTRPEDILAIDGGPEGHGGAGALEEAKEGLPIEAQRLIDAAMELFEPSYVVGEAAFMESIPMDSSGEDVPEKVEQDLGKASDSVIENAGRIFEQFQGPLSGKNVPQEGAIEWSDETGTFASRVKFTALIRQTFVQLFRGLPNRIRKPLASFKAITNSSDAKEMANLRVLCPSAKNLGGFLAAVILNYAEKLDMKFNPKVETDPQLVSMSRRVNELARFAEPYCILSDGKVVKSETAANIFISYAKSVMEMGWFTNDPDDYGALSGKDFVFIHGHPAFGLQTSEARLNMSIADQIVASNRFRQYRNKFMAYGTSSVLSDGSLMVRLYWMDSAVPVTSDLDRILKYVADSAWYQDVRIVREDGRVIAEKMGEPQKWKADRGDFYGGECATLLPKPSSGAPDEIEPPASAEENPEDESVLAVLGRSVEPRREHDFFKYGGDGPQYKWGDASQAPESRLGSAGPKKISVWKRIALFFTWKPVDRFDLSVRLVTVAALADLVWEAIIVSTSLSATGTITTWTLVMAGCAVLSSLIMPYVSLRSIGNDYAGMVALEDAEKKFDKYYLEIKSYLEEMKSGEWIKDLSAFDDKIGSYIQGLTKMNDALPGIVRRYFAPGTELSRRKANLIGQIDIVRSQLRIIQLTVDSFSLVYRDFDRVKEDALKKIEKDFRGEASADEGEIRARFMDLIGPLEKGILPYFEKVVEKGSELGALDRNKWLANVARLSEDIARAKDNLKYLDRKGILEQEIAIIKGVWKYIAEGFGQEIHRKVMTGYIDRLISLCEAQGDLRYRPAKAKAVSEADTDNSSAKKPKGSCADCLNSIIGDEKLLDKALGEGFDIGRDLKPARLKLKKPDQLFTDATIKYREIKPLIDLGILIRLEDGKIKFSDMMIKLDNKGPPDREYTINLVRKITEIKYPVGKRGPAKDKPFHRGVIPPEIRPKIKELVAALIKSHRGGAIDIEWVAQPPAEFKRAVNDTIKSEDVDKLLRRIGQKKIYFCIDPSAKTARCVIFDDRFVANFRKALSQSTGTDIPDGSYLVILPPGFKDESPEGQSSALKHELYHFIYPIPEAEKEKEMAFISLKLRIKDDPTKETVQLFFDAFREMFLIRSMIKGGDKEDAVEISKVQLLNTGPQSIGGILPEAESKDPGDSLSISAALTFYYCMLVLSFKMENEAKTAAQFERELDEVFIEGGISPDALASAKAFAGNIVSNIPKGAAFPDKSLPYILRDALESIQKPTETLQAPSNRSAPDAPVAISPLMESLAISVKEADELARFILSWEKRPDVDDAIRHLLAFIQELNFREENKLLALLYQSYQMRIWSTVNRKQVFTQHDLDKLAHYWRNLINAYFAYTVFMDTAAQINKTYGATKGRMGQIQQEALRRLEILRKERTFGPEVVDTKLLESPRSAAGKFYLWLQGGLPKLIRNVIEPSIQKSADVTKEELKKLVRKNVELVYSKGHARLQGVLGITTRQISLRLKNILIRNRIDLRQIIIEAFTDPKLGPVLHIDRYSISKRRPIARWMFTNLDPQRWLRIEDQREAIQALMEFYDPKYEQKRERLAQRRILKREELPLASELISHPRKFKQCHFTGKWTGSSNRPLYIPGQSRLLMQVYRGDLQWLRHNIFGYTRKHVEDIDAYLLRMVLSAEDEFERRGNREFASGGSDRYRTFGVLRLIEISPWLYNVLRNYRQDLLRKFFSPGTKEVTNSIRAINATDVGYSGIDLDELPAGRREMLLPSLLRVATDKPEPLPPLFKKIFDIGVITDEREKKILVMYYVEDLTLEKIGELLHLGKSRVHQIKRDALEIIRDWFLERGVASMPIPPTLSTKVLLKLPRRTMSISEQRNAGAAKDAENTPRTDIMRIWEREIEPVWGENLDMKSFEELLNVAQREAETLVSTGKATWNMPTLRIGRLFVKAIMNSARRSGKFLHLNLTLMEELINKRGMKVNRWKKYLPLREIIDEAEIKGEDSVPAYAELVDLIKLFSSAIIAEEAYLLRHRYKYGFDVSKIFSLYWPFIIFFKEEIARPYKTPRLKELIREIGMARDILNLVNQFWSDLDPDGEAQAEYVLRKLHYAYPRYFDILKGQLLYLKQRGDITVHSIIAQRIIDRFYPYGSPEAYHSDTGIDPAWRIDGKLKYFDLEPLIVQLAPDFAAPQASAGKPPIGGGAVPVGLRPAMELEGRSPAREKRSRALPGGAIDPVMNDPWRDPTTGGRIAYMSAGALPKGADAAALNRKSVTSLKELRAGDHVWREGWGTGRVFNSEGGRIGVWFLTEKGPFGSFKKLDFTDSAISLGILFYPTQAEIDVFEKAFALATDEKPHDRQLAETPGAAAGFAPKTTTPRKPRGKTSSGGGAESARLRPAMELEGRSPARQKRSRALPGGAIDPVMNDPWRDPTTGGRIAYMSTGVPLPPGAGEGNVAPDERYVETKGSRGRARVEILALPYSKITPEMKEGTYLDIAPRRNATYLLAIDGRTKKTIGHIGIAEEFGLNGAAVSLEGFNLWVNSKYRRLGIATALIRKMADITGERNMGSLSFYVGRYKDRILPLYLRAARAIGVKAEIDSGLFMHSVTMRLPQKIWRENVNEDTFVKMVKAGVFDGWVREHNEASLRNSEDDEDYIQPRDPQIYQKSIAVYKIIQKVLRDTLESRYPHMNRETRAFIEANIKLILSGAAMPDEFEKEVGKSEKILNDESNASKDFEKINLLVVHDLLEVGWQIYIALDKAIIQKYGARNAEGTALYQSSGWLTNLRDHIHTCAARSPSYPEYYWKFASHMLQMSKRYQEHFYEIVNRDVLAAKAPTTNGGLAIEATAAKPPAGTTAMKDGETLPKQRAPNTNIQAKKTAFAFAGLGASHSITAATLIFMILIFSDIINIFLNNERFYQAIINKHPKMAHIIRFLRDEVFYQQFLIGPAEGLFMKLVPVEASGAVRGLTTRSHNMPDIAVMFSRSNDKRKRRIEAEKRARRRDEQGKPRKTTAFTSSGIPLIVSRDRLKEPRHEEGKALKATTIESRISERLEKIRDLQAYAVATDILGQTSYFTSKGFTKINLMRMFGSWFYNAFPQRKDVKELGEKDIIERAKWLVASMRRQNASAVVGFDEVKGSQLNLIEIPSLNLTIDLLDYGSCAGLNDILKQLGSEMRLYFSANKGRPLFFVWGPAIDGSREIKDAVTGVEKSVRVITFEKGFLALSVFNDIVGNTDNHDTCYIYKPLIRRVLSREASSLMGEDTPDIDFHEFASLYGVENFEDYMRHIGQIESDATEVIEAHEVGHISHILASGVQINDELDYVLEESGDQLLISLGELLANLAPNGVYSKILETARRDPAKAYRMLQYQRLVVASYVDAPSAITSSYHFRWEIPILNKILNDGASNLVVNLETLLERDKLFAKINQLFLELLPFIRKDAANMDALAEARSRIEHQVDSILALSYPSDTTYRYRNYHYKSAFTAEDGKDKFSFPMFIDLEAGMPGHWDMLLVKGINRVLRPGEDLLDIPCGYGIASMAFASRARSVVACDISARVLEATRKNIALNSCSNVDIREGGLFSPVEGQVFDVIACDPPAMPVPEGEKNSHELFALMSESGSDGRKLTDRIISESSPYLKLGGRLVLVQMDFLGYERTFELMRQAGLSPRILLEEEVELHENDHIFKIRPYIENRFNYRFIERDGKTFYKTAVIVGTKEVVNSGLIFQPAPAFAVNETQPDASAFATNEKRLDASADKSAGKPAATPVPDRSAPDFSFVDGVIEKLRQAGGVLLGKSDIPVNELIAIAQRPEVSKAPEELSEIGVKVRNLIDIKESWEKDRYKAKLRAFECLPAVLKHTTTFPKDLWYDTIDAFLQFTDVRPPNGEAGVFENDYELYWHWAAACSINGGKEAIEWLGGILLKKVGDETFEETKHPIDNNSWSAAFQEILLEAILLARTYDDSDVKFKEAVLRAAQNLKSPHASRLAKIMLNKRLESPDRHSIKDHKILLLYRDERLRPKEKGIPGYDYTQALYVDKAPLLPETPALVAPPQAPTAPPSKGPAKEFDTSNGMGDGDVEASGSGMARSMPPRAPTPVAEQPPSQNAAEAMLQGASGRAATDGMAGIDIEKVKESVRSFGMQTCLASACLLVYFLRSLGQTAVLIGMYRDNEDTPFQYLVRTKRWGDIDILPDSSEIDDYSHTAEAGEPDYEKGLLYLRSIGVIGRANQILINRDAFRINAESVSGGSTAPPTPAADAPQAPGGRAAHRPRWSKLQKVKHQELVNNPWMENFLRRSDDYSETKTTLINLLAPDHEFKARAFEEVDRLTDPEILAQADTVLVELTPAGEPFMAGTFAVHLNRHFTLRELFLQPTMGANDLSQSLFPGFTNFLPSEINALIKLKPGYKRAFESGFRDSYLMIKAVEILSRQADLMIVQPQDVEALSKYLSGEKASNGAALKRLLSITGLLDKLYSTQRHESAKNLLVVLDRLASQSPKWRELISLPKHKKKLILLRRQASELSGPAPLMRENLADPKEAAENFVEAILSKNITKRVVLAIESGLLTGNGRSVKLKEFFDELERLKKSEKYEKLLSRLVIIKNHAAQNLPVELGDYINKPDENAVFMFARAEVRGVLQSIESKVKTTYIEEGEFHKDPAAYYYPLAEIITATLASYMPDANLDKINRALKEVDVVARHDDKVLAGVLIFTLLPSTVKHDPEHEIMNRYAMLIEALIKA
jgi:tRNA1(Val) A37 N6-methylase TrmN6